MVKIFESRTSKFCSFQFLLLFLVFVCWRLICKMWSVSRWALGWNWAQRNFPTFSRLLRKQPESVKLCVIHHSAQRRPNISVKKQKAHNTSWLVGNFKLEDLNPTCSFRCLVDNESSGTAEKTGKCVLVIFLFLFDFSFCIYSVPVSSELNKRTFLTQPCGDACLQWLERYVEEK